MRRKQLLNKTLGHIVLRDVALWQGGGINAIGEFRHKGKILFLHEGKIQ